MGRMSRIRLAVVAGAVLAATCADGAGRKPSPAGILGEPEIVGDVGVREPSGVAYHAALGRIFVVGDEGSLAILDRRGARLRVLPAPFQVEDVLALADGSLLLVRELGGELIRVDPETGQERRRWRLDTAGLVGGRGSRTNEGFEGLAFRPEAKGAASGVLYLVHQRAPAVIVAAAFDPGAPGERLGGDRVLSRWSFDKEGDLTAATYVPSLQRLLVIADARDRLLVLGMDGTIELEIPLPGVQQEGLAFDDAGTLWVADDRAGQLLRFPGALEKIAEALGAHSTGPK
jgi:uncharacterized protein YjiK